MSTSNYTRAEIPPPYPIYLPVTQPPYPSFEEIRDFQQNQRVLIATIEGKTMEANSEKQLIPRNDPIMHIFWTLNGPFPTAISVMKDRRSPASATPYFTNGAWDPISQESITEPKASSITVCVDELERWEYLWKETHKMDCDTGIPGQERWYGRGYNPEVDDEEDHLLGCCGEPRPRNKNARITVRASSAEFVTIHDYVSALHPWLMGLKANIASSNALWCRDVSEMLVQCGSLDCLRMEEKADWIRYTSRVSMVPMAEFAPQPVFGLINTVNTPENAGPYFWKEV